MKKVPVTVRALIARINRKLALHDLQLKTARGTRMRVDVGDYYVINVRFNGLMQRYRDCDPEELARELGVLRQYEEVVHS
jgi:hypothetical protein